jgi:hypothetical protein
MGEGGLEAEYSLMMSAVAGEMETWGTECQDRLERKRNFNERGGVKCAY